ncbi:MAG: hypothetical protein QM731_12840 [Chitinophagaceae bacterium]
MKKLTTLFYGFVLFALPPAQIASDLSATLRSLFITFLSAIIYRNSSACVPATGMRPAFNGIALLHCHTGN